MTEAKAIEHLKKIVDNEAYSDYFQDVCKTAIKALEKQIAKTPIEKRDRKRKAFQYYCPNCKRIIGLANSEKDILSRNTICECGQQIFWLR